MMAVLLELWRRMGSKFHAFSSGFTRALHFVEPIAITDPWDWYGIFTYIHEWKIMEN